MPATDHDWAPHAHDGWMVRSRCGLVRNYDRSTTRCRGALPNIVVRGGMMFDDYRAPKRAKAPRGASHPAGEATGGVTQQVQPIFVIRKFPVPIAENSPRIRSAAENDETPSVAAPEAK